MGLWKTRPRRNGAANKGGAAERGPEHSEDRKCPLRSVVAAARIPKINSDRIGWRCAGNMLYTSPASSRHCYRDHQSATLRG